MEPLLVAVLVGGALLLLWLGATRRHLRQRRVQAADWDGSAGRPELWTSTARCPHCGSSGGLLDMEGERLWFECLTCGQRHERETKG